MSRDFWDLMLDALEQTTDEEWAQFVEKFDSEHPEVYKEITLLSRGYKLDLEREADDLIYDFTFAA